MKRKQYFNGLRTAVPVIFGFIPVSIAYAVMAKEAGFTVCETVLMSALVFAGASQIMSVGMIIQGAQTAAVAVAAFILNLRHFIMSICIMSRLSKTKIGARLLCAFGVTDESFAIFMVSPEEECTLWYYLGIFSVTYGSWVFGTVIGAFASSFLPTVVSDSLGIAIYALFIALLVPNLKRNIRLLAVVCITAVINLFVRQYLDSGWSIIISSLAGAFIGVFFVKDKEEKE